MTATLCPLPKFRMFTSAGLPLAGGKLYSYQAGTSTPLATYTDAGGGTANENPVTLDSTGQADVWLSPSSAYKLVLKDSSYVTQWTVDNITAETLRADLSDSTDVAKGDNLIATKATWTGAGARTQHDRNEEMPLATDATGVYKDLLTDSSTGLQAFLTAMAGKHCVIPSGTYKVGTGLTVPADTYIHAYGVTLDASAGHITTLTFTDGGGIFGATLTGAGNSSTVLTGIGIYCYGTPNVPAAPTYVKGPLIRDCTIQNQGGYGVKLGYCQDGLTENCTFDQIGYAAQMGVSCTGCRFERCDVGNITPGSSGNAYGISWTRTVDATYLNDTTAYPRSIGCTANDNYIHDIPLWEAIDTHGGLSITATGNYIYNCKTGVAFVPCHYGATDGPGPHRCIAANNEIYVTLPAGGCAISLSGSADVSTEYASGCILNGNSIYGGGVEDSDTYGAIRTVYTEEVEISGNVIIAAESSGICLYANNLGFNVSGNTIRDPHSTAFANPACVLIPAGNNNGTVTGNTFAKRDATLDTYVAISPIRFGSGLSNLDVRVSKNHVSGFTSNSFQNASQTGIKLGGAWAEAGTATISLVSGQASNNVSVTYAEQAPSSARVGFGITSALNVGGKAPILRITATASTGFTVTAYPYDLSTWSASGSLDLHWTATT